VHDTPTSEPRIAAGAVINPELIGER